MFLHSSLCFFFLHLFLHGVLFLLEIGGWCFVGISARGGFFSLYSLVSRLDASFLGLVLVHDSLCSDTSSNWFTLVSQFPGLSFASSLSQSI